MLKQSVIEELKKYTNGAAVITNVQLSRYLGCGRHTTARILAESNLRGIDGRRYHVAEVAAVLMRRMN